MEMITAVLLSERNSQSQKHLTSRKVSYSPRGRTPAGRKLGDRWKEDNSAYICLDSVLSSPGSRTREDPGADETHDLSKEVNSKGRGQGQKWFAETVVAGHRILGERAKGNINKDQGQSILTMLKPKDYRSGHSIFKEKSKDISYSRILIVSERRLENTLRVCIWKSSRCLF